MLFEFLNLLNISSQAFMGAVHGLAGINIHAAEQYDYGPELEVAREFKGNPHFLNSEFKGCAFSGVMVPFSQTWEERTNRGGEVVVTAPMPDKMLGHAILLDKKQCGDMPPEKIMRIGADPRSLGFQRMIEGKMVITYDLGEMNREQLPPWLPQIMDRLETLSKKPDANPAIKSFVEDTRTDFQQVREKLGLTEQASQATP